MVVKEEVEMWAWLIDPQRGDPYNTSTVECVSLLPSLEISLEPSPIF